MEAVGQQPAILAALGRQEEAFSPVGQILVLGSPVNWMDAGDVISGVLRVLKDKGRLFVNVSQSSVGVVSGGG